MVSNESSSNGLTEEQQNAAEHFRELIGGMDFPAAVEVLINHSWNLELENLATTGGGSSTPHPSKYSGLGRRRAETCGFTSPLSLHQDTWTATDSAPANRMSLLGRVEEPLDAEALVTRLKEIISHSSAAIQSARFERSEIQAAQRLRREQDQAYEQSLVLDRAKKMKKQREKEAAQEAEMREKVVQNRKLRLEKALEKRTQFWDRNMLEQPNQNDENVVKLSVKMPNGVCSTRLFNTNHSVKALYYFVRSRPNCPRNFKLQSNFPKRLIECVPANESDLEAYLSEDEDSGDRKSKDIASIVDSQFWLPGENDPPSFAVMELTKPEVIFVLDEDA
ncbi:FAS-associated factor 2 [Cichlidogyrus casuarinus]|uniref:FAS-associated factor 2 n=1 Tax=Cichlidogyrus casuarinus TaxID=1844966 RepID=A0ABD2QFG0_9PLAT